MSSTQDLTLDVHGMHCAACVRRLTATLSRLPGVVVKKVEIGRVELSYLPEQTGPGQIHTAIGDAGFSTASPGEPGVDEG